jgi:CubicO group peptidase (beta-lactamase class C family)
MFTSMAVLKLRDRGKLRLDDSLAQWVLDCPAAWRPITIQQLMRHTSGIPDYEEALEIGSPKYMEFMRSPGASRRIIEEARAKPLDFPPGTKFHYSNTAYILLSQIVERAAGEPFAKFVTRELLRPAGMTRSGVFDGGAAPKEVAKGYTHDDLGWPRLLAGAPLTDGHLKLVPHLPLTPPAGDAGIYSTVDDLWRWSRVMDGGALVPAAEAAEVYTPGLENYGYGWFAGTGFDRPRYRHNGLLPGHVSDFIKFPDDSITIVLLCNLDRARLDRIARDVSAIALGTPYDLPVQGQVVTLTPAQIGALEGVYKMADGKTLTVKMDGDRLSAALEDRYTAGLIPLSPTEFYMPLGDGRTRFTLGADGRAASVNLRYGGEDHVAERTP